MYDVANRVVHFNLPDDIAARLAERYPGTPTTTAIRQALRDFLGGAGRGHADEVRTSKDELSRIIREAMKNWPE